MGKLCPLPCELCILSSVRGLGRAHLFSEIVAPFRRASLACVALTKNNPTLREIIGRHFEMHPVAHDRADAKFAHLAGSVGDNLVLVVEPDCEASVGKNFLDDAFYRQQFFFGQWLESVRYAPLLRVTL